MESKNDLNATENNKWLQTNFYIIFYIMVEQTLQLTRSLDVEIHEQLIAC